MAEGNISDDGSTSLGVAKFFSLTGRHEARSWEDEFTESLIDPQTGIVRGELSSARPCPMCGAAQSREIFVKQGFPHHLCEACKTIFVSPCLTPEHFYQLWYGEKSPYPFLDTVNSETQRRFDRVKFEKVLDGLGRLTDPGSLLDVGCGGGFFVELATEYGWTAEGIDTYGRAADFARSRNLNVKHGDVISADFDRDHWDFVSLWEVIDLVPEPLAVLDASIAKVAKGGFLGLSFRNAYSLAAMILREKCNVFLGSNHCQMMSFDTVKSLLQAKGFELEWSTGYISESQVIKNYLSYSAPYSGTPVDIPETSMFSDEFIHENRLSYKFNMIFKNLDA